MNNIEFTKLQDRFLSHEARSLYLFFIRPRAERGLYSAPLGEMIMALQNNSPVCPFNASPQICLQLIQELMHCGLMAPASDTERAHGKEYRLPLVEAEMTALPALPFAMHSAWRPSAAFAQTALLAGLDSADFSDQELRAFVSYWQGRPEKRNQHAWERAFAQRLSKNREARVRPQRTPASQAVGTAARVSGVAEGYVPRAIPLPPHKD